MWVPTSPRVSREPIKQLGVEPAERLGQAVPDFLEPAGQAGVVEHEPDVVLDDPQALAGAVGRGVEDRGRGRRPRPGRPGPGAGSRRAGASARSSAAGARRAGRRSAVELEPGAGQQVGGRAGGGDQARRAGARCRPSRPRSSARACTAASLSDGPDGRRVGQDGRQPSPRLVLVADPLGGPRPRRAPRGRGAASSPNSASSSAARLSASSTRAAAGRSARRPTRPAAGPGPGPDRGRGGRPRCTIRVMTSHPHRCVPGLRYDLAAGAGCRVP